MIRLIASDIDGTLLPSGSRQLLPELFPLIRQLRQQGILFCAASGRQYPNLKHLFEPVWQDMLFICENGALVMQGDQMLEQIPMPRLPGLALIEDILASPGCEVQVSGRECVYISPRSPGFADHLRNHVKNNVVLCEDFSAIEEPFLKISINMANGVDDDTIARFSAAWSDRFSVALAGRCWLDFTVADKGQGLASLCRHLDISTTDVAAFGDGYNDLQMLRMAGSAWAMESAADAIKTAAGRTCRRVEPVLRGILADAEREAAQ